jgi:hypothetical protein
LIAIVEASYGREARDPRREAKRWRAWRSRAHVGRSPCARVSATFAVACRGTLGRTGRRTKALSERRAANFGTLAITDRTEKGWAVIHQTEPVTFDSADVLPEGGLNKMARSRWQNGGGPKYENYSDANLACAQPPPN